MTRRFLTRAGGVLLAGLLCLGGTQLAAEDASAAANSLARLKSGNARFVSNPEASLPIDAMTRSVAVQGQAPFATVLSCADSRVPPEVIFQTGLGDLFVVRDAGHVPDRAILASIEYGAEHLHVPLIVVMGHEFCGAVKATIETPAGTSLGPNLDFMLNAIRPSVARTASTPEAGRLRAAILANVEETVNDLLKDSTPLRELSQGGSVTLVGAYYELTTGRVYFSEPVQAVAPGTH
jgi:carbonic anhydrase